MKRLIFTYILLLFSLVATSQTFGLGDNFSPEIFDQMPVQQKLIRGDYDLPARHSLKKYCPYIGDQGNFGTCTSWSSAYYARTICEAINNNWTDKQQISRESFSPTFVYTLIKDWDDYDCDGGGDTYYAMKLIQEKGVPKLSDLPYQCTNRSIITTLLYNVAAKYKIDNAIALWGRFGATGDKIQSVKKALSENRPVCMSFVVYESFWNNHSNVWSGRTSSPTDTLVGNHSICIIGYDDTKYGGAFEIVNSWGMSWGQGGYCWIPYSTFTQYANYAVQMICNKKLSANKFSGTLKFKQYSGTEMSGNLVSGGTNHYKLSSSYNSGTKYRVYISNNEPAYVYIISSDLQNNVSKIFPPDNTTSAHLPYKQNNIAIPDESWYIQMDNTIGTDYICVLYSTEQLDINDVITKIKSGSGSFYDKVNYALGNKIVPSSNINYNNSSISFSAESTKTIVPIITEIIHN